MQARMRTKKDVDDYFAGDKIQCLICGKWFKALGAHIVRIHGVGVGEYKTQFNLPWGRGLVAEKTKEKQAFAAKKRISEGGCVFADYIGNKKIMEKAQQAPKRQFRDYDLKRVHEQGLKYNKLLKKETEKKAIAIIERMKVEQIPACYVCMLPGVPALENLIVTCRRNKNIKEEYDKIKEALPKMVEVKTGLTKKEIKAKVFELRAGGKTTQQIANDLWIGKTTIKRILRGESYWGGVK